MSKRKQLTSLEKEARDLSLTKTKRELALLAARYEFLRKLTPSGFGWLYRQTMPGEGRTWMRFDDLVDKIINEESKP